MTDRLSLYNAALIEHLDARRLVSLSENRETRRVLDDVWDGGVVGLCLQAGFWNFAVRSMQYDASPSIAPDFGYAYAFNKPDDWVRTVAVACDEYFREPLNAFNDEAQFWFCDLPTIYVRYVSNDADYGMNFAAWPENFTAYVAAMIALKASGRITGSRTKKVDLDEVVKRALATAKGTDAMDEGTKFQPAGSWSRSRVTGPRRDGGSRSRLIG